MADQDNKPIESSDEKKQDEPSKDSVNYLPRTPWNEICFTFPHPKVEFGKDAVRLLPDAILDLLNPSMPHLKKSEVENPMALLIVGGSSLKESGKLSEIMQLCEEKNIKTEVFSVGSQEPTTEIVDNGVDFAKQIQPHFVVGIGGGSVMDSAKSIAGIYNNGGKVKDYHDGKEFEIPGLPFIAIPTTAGTGSEITNNAVITDNNRGFKKSIRGKHLIAKYIILDPSLTLSCPPEITAHSGSDALVQAIEAFVSKHSHPLSDIYAMEAIILIGRNLRKVVNNGDNYEARAQMLLGSYFAGVAFSNVKLGLVHGLAHPIGYKYKLPHGEICGSLLPWVIEYNLKVRANKYAKISKTLNMHDFFNKYEPEASNEDNTKRLIGMIKELFADIGIPLRLEDLGIEKESFDWIIARTKGGSVNANPREVDKESLKKLLERAF